MLKKVTRNVIYLSYFMRLCQMMTGLVNIHCVVGTSEQWIEGGILVWTGLFTDGSCHWILHLSIWWFGYLHPIVCMTCTEDEQICLLALRQPGGVNEHQWQTKGKKHSFSIWVKDRLVWTGLTKFKQNSPTLLLKRRDVGRASLSSE